MDGHRRGSFDPDADTPPLDGKNPDAALSDDDFLFGFAGQNEHFDASLNRCVAAGQAASQSGNEESPQSQSIAIEGCHSR